MLTGALSLSISIASCNGSENPAPTPAPSNAESSETNLLLLDRGAVVISRTGERQLDTAAIYTIDDDPETRWITPPMDPAHSMVISLPVPGLIERVGVTIAHGEAPRAVLFEYSSDGQVFAPLATIKVKDPSRPEFIGVTPSKASFLRITIQEDSEKTVSISSVSAAGTESGEYRRPALRGGWKISGRDASFAQEGSRVIGTLATEPATHIDGAWGARFIRFLYMRGNEYGYGAFVVSPDGSSLNGLTWYQKIAPVHAAASSYGEKAAEESSVPEDGRVLDRWLERSGGRVPLFGIAFGADGSVQVEESEPALRWLSDRLARPGDFTIVQPLLADEDSNSSRSAATRKLDSLRAELTRRGVEVARIRFEALAVEDQEVVSRTRLDRELLSAVELRINQPKDVAR